VPRPVDKTPITLLYSDENTFQYNYGEALYVALPDLKVNIAAKSAIFRDGNPDEAYRRLLSETKPDVLSIRLDEMGSLASEGKLVDLEPLLKQAAFDINAFHPKLLQQIRDAGDGKLYALPTTFLSDVLYYNKQLFDRYGIPYPTDRMTWGEVLVLAERFPAEEAEEERIYGLAFGEPDNNNPFRIVEQIGLSNGLHVVDSTGSKLTLDTDSWRPIFEAVARLERSGASDLNSMFSDSRGYNLFTLGRAAMRVSTAFEIQMMGWKMKDNPDSKFDWGIAASPVMDEDRNKGGAMRPEEMLAISAETTHLEHALKLLQYMAGESAAKLRAARDVGVLTARNTNTQTSEGVDLSAFTALEPYSYDSLYGPDGFSFQLAELAAKEFGTVRSSKAEVPEMLRKLQAEGQALLDQLNKGQGSD